ncbi:Germ cell-less protein-like 1 [Borealophlyctis nickersoniae]|nr:Germ cell-less protein-like 1 [Borealophlyctis nickersoniae]
MTGLFSDFTLRILGMTYNLHRVVLLQSPYFAAMLAGGEWREQNTKEVTVEIGDPNIDVESVTAVLARLYGHFSAKLTPATAPSLLATALFFQDTTLSDQCLNYIISTTSRHTVLRYLTFADERCYGQHSDRILDACFNLLCREGISMPRVVAALPWKWVERVIASDCFWVRSEWERWRFVKHVVLLRKTGGNPSSTSESKGKSSVVSPMLAEMDGDETDYEDEDTLQHEAVNRPEGGDAESDMQLSALLSRAVIYTHLPFATLWSISEDEETVVSESVLRAAHWNAFELRARIRSFEDPTSIGKVELGVGLEIEEESDEYSYEGYATEEEEEESVTLFDTQEQGILPLLSPLKSATFSRPILPSILPSNDTSKIDERKLTTLLSRGSPCPYSRARFPPFRFGVKFENLRELNVGVKMVSEAVFYAG